MAYEKIRRPIYGGDSLNLASTMRVVGASVFVGRATFTGGQAVAVTTAASTGTGIGPRGYTHIAQPAANAVFTLAAMSAGDLLTVTADTGSTKTVDIRTASSGCTLVGSTNDRINLTTGQGLALLQFVAMSTSKIAFVVGSGSTAARYTLAASTR